MGKSPIYAFTGDYSFLSNFYIEPDGSHVEGEYQGRKFPNPACWGNLALMSPARAKKEGQRIHPLRPNWDNIRIDVMRELVLRKFTDHPALGAKLLATGDAELIEGNNWGDRFWGRIDGGYGTGENWLGKVLMETREMLRQG